MRGFPTINKVGTIKTLISLKRIDLQSKLIGNFIKEIVPRRSEAPLFCYFRLYNNKNKKKPV